MGASRRGAPARDRAPERRPAASVVACVAMQDPTFASLVELSAALEIRRLPTSLQIIGHPFAEATVLRIGWAYEQATEWHRGRPPEA